MRKIPTIFLRDPDNRALVTPKPHPDCAWVFAGEGVATRKYDGTCVLIRSGRMYKRREVKPGKEPPRDFELVETDPVTGKSVGWVPVGDGPEDRWHMEALESTCTLVHEGTYELCGPKVQGNPERFDNHTLVPHAQAPVYDLPDRSYENLRYFLETFPHEGIVFQHEDGRMAKIKRKDFGFR